MVIFDGKKISEIILENLRKEVSSLKRKPKLAIIKVGENPEVNLYISNKEKAAEKVGIELIKKEFSENVAEEEILTIIDNFNKDSSIDGVIIQLPLPEKFNPTKLVLRINPQKDVDGFHPENRKLLKKGKANFLPPLPSAISIALQETQKFSPGKEIIALVKSDIFSETLSDFLETQGLKVKTLIFNKDKEDFIKKELQKADVIISVLGEPKFIKGEFLKEGVAVIDAGIRVIDNKIVGDLDREGIEEKASFITPVPRGIGPLVVALLLNNVYLSASKKK